MKRPHVVHIIPTLSLAGAERFVVSLCKHVDPNVVQQSIVTLWDTVPLADELPDGVALHSFHIDTVPKYKRVQALAALLTELDATVVHTHLFSADLWGRLAARRLNLPVVTTEHNVNQAEPLHWRLIKRLMNRYSDVYTAPSLAVSVYMHRQYGIDTEHVRVIPHGIDTSRFSDLPLPTFDTPKHILVLGRLVEQKGHRILLEAIAQGETDDCTVTIVGSGPLESELQQYAEHLDIAESIVWQQAVTDVVPVYAAADIVVIPSLWEGFGLVALEAMASARVVVASSTGGLSDLIQDGETGWLVPPGDASMLANLMRSVVDMKREDVLQVATAARTWATTHGDITAMAAQYRDIYTSVQIS